MKPKRRITTRLTIALSAILLSVGCESENQGTGEDETISESTEMADQDKFESLTNYLSKVPGITGTIGKGTFENGNWWVKFTIDVDHPQAWNVVQEMGYVLNYLSLEDRLPTVFMPV